MRTGEKTARAFHQARPPASARQLSRKPRRRGFTLTEIMIAMGVLAVGMAMVAGALHAGIQTHLRTIDDIMRQLIGDNALAIVQASIRHSGSNGINQTYLSPDGKLLPKYQLLDDTFLSPANLRFPTNANTPYGAAVFIKARLLESGGYANDYDLLIVPYTIIGSGTVEARTLASCTIATSNGESKITVTTPNALTVGSAVINPANGEVSIVKEKDADNDTIFVLWDEMSTGPATITTLASTNITDRLECSKPVQTKTALSPDPMWAPGS